MQHAAIFLFDRRLLGVEPVRLVVEGFLHLYHHNALERVFGEFQV
jgi:hypothetical protein